ncbi:MAG TPA: hypothetical protein VHV83_18105, partial [Armatimonadota bacterium]|nr:hypothetical protein [Armatimonadota bacterium]
MQFVTLQNGVDLAIAWQLLRGRNAVENLWNTFTTARPRLERQYVDLTFDSTTGLDADALNAEADALLAAHAESSPMRLKAMLFELIVTKGRIGVDADDWFADKLDHGNILRRVCATWHQALLKTRIPD